MSDNPIIRLGFVPANRGFFSAELAAKMRRQTIEVMESRGIEVVVPNEEQTKVGCVENIAEARLAADLMREADVEGIVVGAVNFGDEQAAGLAVREAGLDVPVMIFGCQEEEVLTKSTPRRDSFCGLLSIGDALRQLDIPYSIAGTPICYPTDASFARDLDWFTGVCRVVNGVRGARYAQIGARPEAFWTCRYDERLLQQLGPTTVVIDLAEAVADIEQIADDEPEVLELLGEICGYADHSGIPDASLLKMAKYELYLRRFAEEHDIDAFAIQCWANIQNLFGICTCSTMSRLGNEGIPCACEVDVLGAMSMHACSLASDAVSALADWNNLHNADGELANIWHCGVFPRDFAGTELVMGRNKILAEGGSCVPEGCYGLVEFTAAPGPVTLFRAGQEPDAPWNAVIAEGAFEENVAETFGAYGWCRIPNLDRLYREILLNHFPHHVAITKGHVGNVLWEAFGKYLGFDVYHATQETPGIYTPRLPF
jgi:L-fucose isomerase-like protein